jgi:sugar phosphate permease
VAEQAASPSGLDPVAFLKNFFAVVTGRRKIFYGWWMLAGAVVAMAIGSGVSFWSLGLYVGPLEDEFGWSRAQVTLGFSLSLLVSGLTGPFVGRWIDRRGPRTVILVGSILTSLSYLLLSTTDALWQWYAFQSVNAVFRQMMFIIPFQTLMSRWFERRRGVALSVLGTGFSLGGFAVVPLMRLVISERGWDGSFVVAGIAIAAVYIPLTVFLIRNSPSDVGARPDGAEVPPDGRPLAPPGGVALGVALRTPLFWALAAALTLFFFGMFGWLVHQVPFYESVGISRSTAAAIVSAAAGLGIFARLTFGYLSDRIGQFERMAMVLSALLMAGMITLLVNSATVGIIVFLTFWICGSSAGPMMEAILLTRAFGLAHFATILGAVVVVETSGQIMSPTIAGAIYDSTGSYDWALVMFMGAYAAAFVLFAVASRLPRPDWRGAASPG